MKCVVWDKWHLSGLVRDVEEAVDVRAYNSQRRSPQGCGLRSHKDTDAHGGRESP